MLSLAEFKPGYLRVEEQGDVTIATFTRPQLTDEENIEQLGHELVTLVEQFNSRKVIVNLEEVEFVTSSVLGKLITLHRKLHRKDGTLIVCGARPAVQDILRSTRLDHYFNLAPGVDAGVHRLTAS